MAEIKPTVLNLLLVTMMAAVGIHAMKYLSARWNIPGFKELFGSL
jgi:hypothetical protein